MGNRRGHHSNWWTETTNGIANWIGVVIVGVLVAASALGIAALGQRPEAASTVTYTPTPLAITRTPTPTPEPTERIDLPGEGAQVVFFGDSWTEGYAAAPSTDGYAYVLGRTMGWDPEVLGRGSTGYVNPGVPNETFVQRSAGLEKDDEVQLVFLQGSINDVYIDRDEYPRDRFPDVGVEKLGAAVDATLANLRAAYPNAKIIAWGPPTVVLPVPSELTSVDSVLSSTFDAAGVPYISGLGFITQANYDDVIDTSATNHPSTAGHAYLAERLAQTLREMSGQS